MCRTSLHLATLLNSCTSVSSLKIIHSLTITHGLSHHLQISTKLLSLASSLSTSIHYALQMFDEIPHRDSFLYNTLFRAYSGLGPLNQIFPLYSQMHRLNIYPDHFTFPFIIRSSAVLLRIREGKQAHCNVIKHGFDTDVFANTSLVLLYSIRGEILDMELVFRGVDRNVCLWTAMVAGYVQNSIFGKGLDVFRSMVGEENGVKPNEVTIVSVLPCLNGPLWLGSGRSIHGFVIKDGLHSFTSLVNALTAMYGKCGDLEVARRLFDEMLDRNLVSWNTMIAVYEQRGEGTKAIVLFKSMIVPENNVKFNAVTLVSVISACASLCALDIGKWVHELAINQGLHTDVRIGNAFVAMYSKCGNLDMAYDVFTKIQSKGVVSWSAMIAAYASHGHAHKALELFKRMKSEGRKPNSFTYTSVLTACCHSGLVDEGMKHFESMKKEHGIIPKLEHCACLVDLLGRAGRLNEAYKFVKEMEMKPDVGVWGALLGACRIHGDVRLAELAAEDLFKVEPYNVTCCLLMSNIYADVGRWKDAARMRSLMKKRELKKMPGCSSIET